MQSHTIMAFRKRMKKRGYRNISIFKQKDSDNYRITAVEPLANIEIICEHSILAMHHLFRF